MLLFSPNRGHLRDVSSEDILIYGVFVAKTERGRMLVCIVCEKYEIPYKGNTLLCGSCLDDPLELEFYKQCPSCEVIHHGNVMCGFCTIKNHIHSVHIEVLA